jgi:hypothetical protein
MAKYRLGLNGPKWNPNQGSTTESQDVSGSLPFTQVSYGSQTEETGCGNCSMEPSGSGWVALPGLINDLLIGDLNNRAANNPYRIYVRVNFVTNSDSSISVPSISIDNNSNATISIMAVKFKTANNVSCNSPCIAGYNSNYTIITGPSLHSPGITVGIGGIIFPKTMTGVSLIPSGYQYNPNNNFYSSTSVNVIVILGDSNTGQAWPPISFTIK